MGQRSHPPGFLFDVFLKPAQILIDFIVSLIYHKMSFDV